MIKRLFSAVLLPLSLSNAFALTDEEALSLETRLRTEIASGNFATVQEEITRHVSTGDLTEDQQMMLALMQSEIESQQAPAATTDIDADLEAALRESQREAEKNAREAAEVQRILGESQRPQNAVPSWIGLRRSTQDQATGSNITWAPSAGRVKDMNIGNELALKLQRQKERNGE